jgi:1-acyl-sn-glycerol-3-phosphate acyltransferase
MQQRAMPGVLQDSSMHAKVPDLACDAHPFGSWLLQMGFDTWIRAAYRREIVMPDDFRLAPGTLIASNHLRDVDGPMLGIVLARRRGLRSRGRPPFYATREDLFRPGILSRLTVHWPAPVSALLGHVSLAWFFPLGRAEPMRRVREFTLGEALLALCDEGCADEDCHGVLNARGRRETGVTPGSCTVRAAAVRRDPPLESWWGLRRLTLPAFRKVAPSFRAAVATQLAHFTDRLERGFSVYFSPEGTISMDGHFSRIRAGFYRLVRATTTRTWIQPMALAYDTLAPGRSRVVIHVGARFLANATLGRRAFDAALRRAILDCVPVTPSHLLARYLLHGPTSFTRGDLAGWMARSHAALRTMHPSLDPLFARQGVEAITNERLRWLERMQLAERRGATFENICPRDAPPGWRTPANVVRYLDNNLADLVPDADRVLPC